MNGMSWHVSLQKNFPAPGSDSSPYKTCQMGNPLTDFHPPCMKISSELCWKAAISATGEISVNGGLRLTITPWLRDIRKARLIREPNMVVYWKYGKGAPVAVCRASDAAAPH